MISKSVMAVLVVTVCVLTTSACTGGDSSGTSATGESSPSGTTASSSASASPTATSEPIELPRGTDPDGTFTPTDGDNFRDVVLLNSTDLPLTSLEEAGPATLELFVHAGQDASGELTWDDGQPWSLIGRDGDGVFRLLDALYVQLGQVDYWASWSYDDEVPVVFVLVTGGGSLVGFKFTHDKAAGVFLRTEVFATEGNRGDLGSTA